MIAPKGTAPGRFMESVILHTDAPGNETMQVPVNVLVKTDVYANSETVDSFTRPCRRTLTILFDLIRVSAAP